MDFRRTRILFFTIALGRGGAEMHLLRLLNHLDRDRFELSVAVAQRGGEYEQDVAPDVEVHHLPTGSINSTALHLVRAIRPLRELIRRTRPDILCPVLEFAGPPAFAAVSGLRAAPKVVPLVQCVPSVQFGNGGPLGKGLPGRVVYRLMKTLYPRADRVVAISEGVAEDVRPLLGPHPERLEVIYNAGVDARVLSAGAEPLDRPRPDGPLVVSCARLSPEKGHVHLIRAFARVREKVPATLWIVGEGAERPRLEALIGELGLEEHVVLLGFQPLPARFMAAAELFAHPALVEAFGNVIVEAMASGAPVVATDCLFGPGEIIQHDKNGLLVPPADPDALAEAMLKVLQSPNLRACLSANGRTRAMDFTAEAIAAQYGQLFETLVHPGETPAWSE